MAKKVFVIVLNWNGWKDTIECVESLEKIDYADCKTVIIDNGSTDGSEEILRKKFPGLTILETDENLGFAGGANFGMRYALNEGADYVVLLNNDTIVDPGFVKGLVSEAEKNREAGLLCSKVYFYDRRDVIWYAGATFNELLGWGRLRGYNLPGKDKFENVEETERAGGCSIMATREFCEKAGLLDEEYFCYCEDLDWGMRARRLGFKVLYVPTSIIWHKESSSTGGKTRAVSLYYTARNTLKCVDKNRPLFFPLNFLRYAAVGAISVLSLFTMDIPKALGIKRVYQGMRDYFHGRFGAFRDI